ncbi:NUDIX domain-containing protein [Solitalea koreensis]|uniref:NUDIX domain-containing protein n=1 Tax=Solitalea koreensis TaxID=543615 RepID=A0A521DEW9_9SPHI|nr:NUDIX domain-containing protein [Solitalea koreensis]SMO69510.1 NUDIX domain-containing protein [Solitalea koreensis]
MTTIQNQTKRFNIRVYGILINDRNEVLVSDEWEYGMEFSKFPGGGLEFGEGTIEGLKREFQEECNCEIEVLKHFYTTDFFVESMFGTGQLISIYYLVKNSSALTIRIVKNAFDFLEKTEPAQCFRWIPLERLSSADMTFPVDKHVAEMLNQTKF